MKTKQIKTLAITLFVLLGLQVTNLNASPLLQDKKETRKVAEFDQIELSIPANLYLIQGSKNELIIEADDDLLGKIKTEVFGTNLNIQFEKWYNYKGVGSINIYITVQEIKRMNLSGSGDIIAKSAISADKLSFEISGSGSILIHELSVKSVNATITGSGDIKLNGNTRAGELDVTVTGSGDFECENIEFKNGEMSVTGSGTIRAHVIDELDANVTGSGRIYYKGDPVVDAEVTGSGKVKKEM
jgi:hypothetical protein